MKYLVIGDLQAVGGKYQDVARVSKLRDAMLVAKALHGAEAYDSVQVWRIHKGRHAYNALCISQRSTVPGVALEILAAIVRCGQYEKDWQAKQKLDRAVRKFFAEHPVSARHIWTSPAGATGAGELSEFGKALYSGDFARAEELLAAFSKDSVAAGQKEAA